MGTQGGLRTAAMLSTHLALGRLNALKPSMWVTCWVVLLLCAKLVLPVCCVWPAEAEGREVPDDDINDNFDDDPEAVKGMARLFVEVSNWCQVLLCLVVLVLQVWRCRVVALQRVPGKGVPGTRIANTPE